MEEALKPILDWLGGNWGWVVAFFFAFFEIVPIKLHPITSIISWLCKGITKDICSKITVLQEEVNDIKLQAMEDEKDRIRYEVLAFAGSCRNHVLHTKDEFQHIIALNDKYERLLKATNDTNGVFVAEYAYIKELYKKCQIQNDFLV